MKRKKLSPEEALERKRAAQRRWKEKQKKLKGGAAGTGKKRGRKPGRKAASVTSTGNGAMAAPAASAHAGTGTVVVKLGKVSLSRAVTREEALAIISTLA